MESTIVLWLTITIDIASLTIIFDYYFCLASSRYTIIDQILASFLEIVTQSGVAGIGLSDYQLIYCTRNISVDILHL